MADDDVVVAYWRCSILLASGHGPLITQLADALEQKTQRRTTMNRRMPTAELASLLGAYVRIMEGYPANKSKMASVRVNLTKASGL